MQPRNAAFVLWIDPPPAGEPPETLRGVVEHVDTSTRLSFRSAEALLRFLADHAGPEPAAGRG